MTKTEKQRIRLKIAKILDTHCRQCKYFSMPNFRMSPCRQCPYGKRMQELSRPLWGEDREADLRGKTGRWTEDEDFYLLNHYGIQPIETLSARTGRSIQAIRKRLETLKEVNQHDREPDRF